MGINDFLFWIVILTHGCRVMYDRAADLARHIKRTQKQTQTRARCDTDTHTYSEDKKTKESD